LTCLKKITVGKWNVNTYFIIKNYESWIIDPGDEFNRINEFLISEKLKIKGILVTHAHFDHIGAVQELRKTYNIPFYLHSKEKKNLLKANFYKAFVGGDKNKIIIPEIDIYLDNVKYLELSDTKIEIIHTPGHSAGEMSFVVDNNIFIGDLIIGKNAGRSDLPYADNVLLKNSINLLFEKYNGYTAYPGHGEKFIINKNFINSIVRDL